MAIQEVKDLKTELKGTLTALHQRIARAEARLDALERPPAPPKSERVERPAERVASQSTSPSQSTPSHKDKENA